MSLSPGLPAALAALALAWAPGGASGQTEGLFSSGLGAGISGPSGSIVAGTSANYTISVSETLGQGFPVLNVTSVVTATSGATFTSFPSGCAQSSPNKITCDIGSIGSGLSLGFLITLSVAPSATGSVIVQHSASGLCIDFATTVPCSALASDASSLVRETDLEAGKDAAPDPEVVAGEILAYGLGVLNRGPSDSSGSSLIDTLPAGVTLLSAPGCSASGGTVDCPIGGLAPGGTATRTVTVRVDAATTGSLTNTVNVSASDTDPSPNNDDASVTTTVVRETDLSVEKTASAATVAAGGTLTYTLTVGNAGPSDAAGVTVTDSLAPGVTLQSAPGCTSSGSTVTCSPGDLAAGAGTTFTLQVGVDPSTSGTITNTASITGDDPDSDPSNDADDAVTTVVREADLAISKLDLVDPVVAGGTLTYVLTVTNNGISDASGATVLDTLPPELTVTSVTPGQGSCTPSPPLTGAFFCDLGPMTRGQTVTIFLEADVDPLAAGTLANTATVSGVGDDVDPDANNNEALELTSVLGEADLSVTVTDDPDPVLSGNTLTYHLTAANAGPSEATGVVLTDALPGATTFFSAAPSQGSCSQSGGTVTCQLGALAAGVDATVDVVVTLGAAASGTLTDVATVAGNQPDPDASNNTAVETTTVNPPIDLEVTVTDLPDPVAVGGSLLYTVETVNHGPFTATGVDLVNTLPQGVTLSAATPSQGSCLPATGVVSCMLGSLGNGASASVTLQVTVGASAPGTLSNTAVVSGEGNDLDPTNNTATAETTVLLEADLALAKTASPEPVAAGETLTYSFTVTNLGPSAVSGVTVTDVLPAGLLPPGGGGGGGGPNLIFSDDFESGNLSAWSVVVGSAGGGGGPCSVSGSILTCAVGALASGASATVTFAATVGPGAAATLTNNASVSGNETDPDPTNNRASATSSVLRRIDLGVSIADSPDPVTAGAILTYTVEVDNAGPSTATGVELEDPLPPEVTPVSVTPSQGTCSLDSLIQCDLGSLAGGAAATVEIRVSVAPGTTGALTNPASAGANETDTNPANNTDTETTMVTGSAAAGPPVEGVVTVEGPPAIPALSPVGLALLALLLAAAAVAALLRRDPR